MPAPFVASIFGYRENGKPNTSDSNDTQSVTLGVAMAEELGMAPADVRDGDLGALLEVGAMDHLRSVRPDLDIERSRSAFAFAQYAHLAVFPAFKKGYSDPVSILAPLRSSIQALPEGSDKAHLRADFERATQELSKVDSVVARLKAQMPEESLLKIDLTVAESSDDDVPLLHIALSSKWSLRTDRAQDCVSQGSKLVAQRRGRMPHYAVLTMEPRPAMLKILGDGSGAVDCVYHLHLAALTAAIDRVKARSKNPDRWSPGLTFRRLIDQGRLKDYDDLCREVRRVPTRATEPSLRLADPADLETVRQLRLDGDQ